MPSPKSPKPSACKNRANPDSTRVLGVDPGIRGGLVLLESGKMNRKPEKLPVSKEGSSHRVDVFPLIRLLRELQPGVCVLEKPQGRPEAAVQSVLTTGINWGILYGILQAEDIPIVLVDAVTWTRAIHSLDKTCEHMDEAKQKSLLVFRKLYPKSDVTHDGIIDAALIAFWYSWKNGKLGL
jgi:hypothetical protein